MTAADFAYCPTLQKMMRDGFITRPDGETVPISSASTPNNLRCLRELVLNRVPTRTTEVGFAYGASALAVTSSLAELHGTGRTHTAIDPYQTSVWQGCGLLAIDVAGLSNLFVFHERSSAVVLPELVNGADSYDLIYVDGSHLFEDVFIDFFYSTQLLAVGGLLLFDDSTDPHVKKLLGFIRTNYAQTLQEFDLRPFGPSQQSRTKRVANYLGIRQLTAFTKISEPPRAWDTRLGRF